MIENLEEERKKKSEQKRNRELADIRTVLSTASGRRLYWRIMSMASPFKISYTGEINSTNFNEGRRSVGTFMFSELFEANPNFYNQMQQEWESESKSEEILEKMNQKDSLI